MAGPYYRRDEDRACICGGIVIGSLVLAVFAMALFTDLVGLMAPHYSAAIDSVSGLGGGDLGGNHTLKDPLFNVTLRVTTRGFLRHDCVAPGSLVEVSYAGVPLAAGPARWSCARLWTSKRQRVVAWGADVRVPQFALDGLAADVRSGTTPAFDVAVRMPSTHDNGHEGTLVSCTGLRAGDAATLRNPCAVSNVDAVMPASSDVHGGGAVYFFRRSYLYSSGD